MSHYLALDLGAESGRDMTGRLAGGFPEIAEMHRFPNVLVRVHQALEGAGYSYEQLAALPAEARPFAAIVDPDAFRDPEEMPRQSAGFCDGSGQEPPRTHGGYARAISESLALRYRQLLEYLEKLNGRPVRTIHIVGGGARNAWLKRFAADCTGRQVPTGPSETTASATSCCRQWARRNCPGSRKVARWCAARLRRRDSSRGGMAGGPALSKNF